MRINDKGKIFAKGLEDNVIEQFNQCLEDESCIKGALMPDAHYGYTLPIGGVILNKNKIFPSYVGYDIGCGMCSVLTTLKKEDIIGKEDKIFDEIYKQIPCGVGIGGDYEGDLGLLLTDFGKTIWESNKNQIGTLGGGNHFIELGYDKDNNVWITIHSGSRGFGYKIADHYMKLAKQTNIDISKLEKDFEESHQDLKKYNPEKYGEVLQNHIDNFIIRSTKGECGGNNGFDIESKNGKDYIIDMNFALEYALKNRQVMIEKVLKILGTDKQIFINKNHNCADFLENGIVRHRKGATSSDLGEIGIIPGNMKDGVALVKGKGNDDFLKCSSHGAGRVLGRKEAHRKLNIDDFKDDMKGIKAKVESSTLDESRFAYKNFQEVLDLQKDSIEIQDIINPIINIKG